MTDKKYWSERIQNLAPYTPGEQPKDQTFIKLNTNENPYPPSPEVGKAIQAALGSDLRLYPDPEAAELCGAVAQFYGVGQEQVFCGNGSDEVLALSFYALFSPGREILFPDITYSFYPVFANLFHLDYREVPLRGDFTLPVEPFLGGNGGAVICNPNAPTGKSLPLSDIRRILEGNPDSVVLVDEAYIDFGAQSAVPLLPEYSNLLIVSTMSKSRSLAGMRIGYALGNPDLIAAIRCVKNSFNSYPLDRLAQAAGTAAMRDTPYFQRVRKQIMETRDRSAESLREMGFIVHDSDANFLFLTYPGISGEVLQRALRCRGFLVRRFDLPRIRDCLRITVGLEEEMAALCAACKEILGGDRRAL